MATAITMATALTLDPITDIRRHALIAGRQRPSWLTCSTSAAPLQSLIAAFARLALTPI